MNIAVALTLDGLVRALRWKEHELADEAEQSRPIGNAPLKPAPKAADRTEGNDDLGRR